MSVLEVTGLTKSFGGVRALDDVSFSVEAGEKVALIGPNGAGKSTCFNLINGQLRPDAGRIRLGGRDVTRLPPRARNALGVARTFQVAAVFRSLTVRQNIEVALAAQPGGATRAADALLGAVDLAAQAARPSHELPYGAAKRLELAIALAGVPRVLLLDEPTAGMAAGERSALVALVARLAAERGLAVLFTEHSMDAVFALADRVIVLVRGEILAQGAPAAMRADPRVQAAYLGPVSAA